MFSKETVVIEVDRQHLDTGSAERFAELLKKLSHTPKAARAKRSAFMLSFEAVGVNNLARDARARRYVANLVEAVPFVGYFLNGDAPFFHLRRFSQALSHSEAHGFTIPSFVEAHHRLYRDAAAFCPSVGDVESVLEEVFVVNLVPEVLHQDPKLQARAMRELHPVIMVALSASPKLSKRAFSEAERTWGRSVADFDSPEAFLREFERTFRERLEWDTVRSGIARLVEDVGPLNTISAFGFHDANPEKVEKNILRAKAGAGWAFVDVRGLGANDTRTALLKEWDAQVLVLVLRPAELVLPISLFIREVVDNRERIDLGDGRPLSRCSGQSVVVVCEGLKEFKNVPWELERISYWLFASQLDSKRTL